MIANTFILVFPSDALWLDIESNPVMPILGVDGECFTLDGNIAFVRTRLPIEELMRKLEDEIFCGKQFLLADIGDADRAGMMMPVFWERFAREERQDAAA